MVAREGFVICKSERGFRGGCKTSNRKKKGRGLWLPMVKLE